MSTQSGSPRRSAARLTRIATIAAALSLTATTVPATASAASSTQPTYTTTAHIADLTTGVPVGTVTLAETRTVIDVNATLQNLRPNYPYWIAIYSLSADTNCKPYTNATQAGYPDFGLIVTDATGAATFQTRTSAGPTLTRDIESVSIRRGDNSFDIDGDGVTGWKDEVAVHTHLRTGLIGCDAGPVHS